MPQFEYMNHTKLPWCQGRNHPDEVFADIPGDYSRVAHCGDIGRGESEDNAEFIVKACNSYYSLVEACRIAIRRLEQLNTGGMEEPDPVEVRLKTLVKEHNP